MSTTAVALLVAGTMLGIAAPAQPETFSGMKYLDGLPGQRQSKAGALVLEGGQLRFQDRRGRVVFVLPVAGLTASVGAEKRTTFGSVLRSSALMMVAIPLSVGQVDPSQAWSRDTRSILVIKIDEASGGATVRWRGPAAQLSRIVDAINRAAREAESHVQTLEGQ